MIDFKYLSRLGWLILIIQVGIEDKFCFNVILFLSK